MEYNATHINLMRNYLCLSIEGLQTGMIGSYGNTWIHTPTLDSLACRSVLFDRFYASSLDLSKTLTGWQRSLTHIEEPALHKIFLTDHLDVYQHEMTDSFDEKHRLHHPPFKYPARRIEETQFFRNMATVADLIRNRQTENFLFWAHFKGFLGHWDFPLSYRKRYQIDEDPPPYSGVDLPEIAANSMDSDVVQSIREAYSGGITLLDETLAGLLELLNEEGLEENTLLLLTSTVGFSLGEHCRIGKNDDLYGENIHLPLFIRFPADKFAGYRSQTLLQPSDIFTLLDNERLPEEPDEVHPFIRVANNPAGQHSIREEVIVMPEWLLYRKSSGDELYVKPDDRWEINDVAIRCPHILNEIDEILKGTKPQS